MTKSVNGRAIRPIALLMLAWAIFVVLEVLAIGVVSKIQNNDQLEKTFESQSQAFKQFQETSDKFGSTETDILVLFEADTFADAANQAPVSDFLVEVQFADYIALALSPFSFTIDGPGGDAELLLPAPSLDQAQIETRLRAARTNMPELQRLLSDDLDKLLVVLVAPDLPEEIGERSAAVEEIRALAEAATAGTSVKATLTGFPVLRSTVVQRLDEDFVVLNVLGLAAGTLVAIAALGSVTLGVLIAFAAHTARLWVVAAMVGFGFEVNAVTVTLPTLILVLVFAEVIHMGVEVKRAYVDGVERPLRTALANVFPAAILAALTTGIAFAGLMIAPSALVFQLGAFGVAAVICATLLAFVLFALMVVTIDRMIGMERICLRARSGMLKLFQLSPVADWVNRRARLISILGLAAIALTTTGYLRVEPNYSLFEGLRSDEAPMQAIERIEASLGPVTAFLFEHPSNPPERLSTVRVALTELSRDGPVLAAGSEAEKVPDALRSRLLSPDGKSVLLTMPYRYEGSAEARTYVGALNERIAQDPRLSNLGAPTGIVHVSAFGSAEILNAFTLCFILAATASGVFVSVWLRNPTIGLIAILPNILPITLVGSLMWLTGVPLTFTTGIALTIAFGIAVDDTVHVLNRVRLVARHRGVLDRYTVQIAVKEISPALVLTSIVLTAGIVGTLFSSLPGLVDFGMLTIIVFALALLADIVLLPALLILALATLPKRFLYM